jgi:hypothetical protein
MARRQTLQKFIFDSLSFDKGVNCWREYWPYEKSIPFKDFAQNYVEEFFCCDDRTF